jgi:hypothetical protein
LMNKLIPLVNTGKVLVLSRVVRRPAFVI